MEVLYYTLTFAVGAALGWVALHLYGLYTKRRAANEAAEVLARGRQEADGIRKEAELRSKEEIFKRREEFEKETQDIRNELKLLEKRLSRCITKLW